MDGRVSPPEVGSNRFGYRSTSSTAAGAGERLCEWDDHSMLKGSYRSCVPVHLAEQLYSITWAEILLRTQARNATS